MTPKQIYNCTIAELQQLKEMHHDPNVRFTAKQYLFIKDVCINRKNAAETK